MRNSNINRRPGTGRIRSLLGPTVIAATLVAGAGAPAAGASASTDDPSGLGQVFSADVAEALEGPRRTDQTGLGVIFSAEIAEALAAYVD